MNIRQYLIPVSVKPVAEVNSKSIPFLVYNYIPAMMYKEAQAQVILEQDIHESVPIYKEARDYLVCELRSTIQHEAMHRSEELDWQQAEPERRMTFEELARPARAEIEPERAEEDCLPPETVSGQIENVTVHDLFEQAKSQANINPAWKNDILAATLVEGRAGEYLMKSLSPDELQQAQQIGDAVYRQGNKLLIDVREHIRPWVVEQKTLSPVVQTKSDGAVTTDPDLMREQGLERGTIPPVPSIPTVPSI